MDTFFQGPKSTLGDLSRMVHGKRFQLWSLGLQDPERHLAKCLKNNSYYPFFQQHPNVFVLEYYQDTLWKGTVLFLISITVVISVLVNQVQRHETWGIPMYFVVMGLWQIFTSLPLRRLVLNHQRGIYHFTIQNRTVYQGPLHLIYLRLAFNSDARGRCFFQLVLCGHKLEPLVMLQLSEHYEQVEYLGRYMARKLNINYFDCLATSYRHVIRYWPPVTDESDSKNRKHSSSIQPYYKV